MDGFKPMKGYDGYFVNSAGEVFSSKYNKLLKAHKNTGGYLQIRFEINGKEHYKRIHRLVAENFLPEAHTVETVNHKNFDKKNNSVENLEWMTFSENIQHFVKFGTRVGGSKPRPFGDKKICSVCGKDKMMDDFPKGKGVGGRNSWCRICEKDRQTQYYKRNREKILNEYPAKIRYNSRYANMGS